MKTKIIILLLLLATFTGCKPNENKKNNNNNNKEPVIKKEDIPVKKESFSNEKYDNFPEVKNIVPYLKKDSEDVKVLDQTNQKLVFCLKEEVVDIEDESIVSSYDYIKLLEKEGYKLSILDGTISSTFVLEKDDYTLNITQISNIDEWKEVHHKEMNTEVISNENLVCEISKNRYLTKLLEVSYGKNQINK